MSRCGGPLIFQVVRWNPGSGGYGTVSQEQRDEEGDANDHVSCAAANRRLSDANRFGFTLKKEMHYCGTRATQRWQGSEDEGLRQPPGQRNFQVRRHRCHLQWNFRYHHNLGCNRISVGICWPGVEDTKRHEGAGT